MERVQTASTPSVNLSVFTIVNIIIKVNARPSEPEGRHFDPRHSIDVSFDFPLFRLAVALNTRKTEN